MIRTEKRALLTAACSALAAVVLVGLPAPVATFDGEVEASMGEPEENHSKRGSEAPRISGPRDLFALQGIDQSHFDLLTDNTPWQEGETEPMLKIMYRLHHNFRLMDVESWSLGIPRPAQLAKNPEAYRGEIFHLAGRVVSIEVPPLAPEVARRFELSRYYRCDFLLGEARQPAVLFTRTIPEAWKPGAPLDAPAGAFAVFLKLGSEDTQRPLPIFVTARVAWYLPTQLGDLGFDVGLLDDLRPGKSDEDEDGEPDGQPRSRLRDLRLGTHNRECFYQLLAAAGRAKPGELLAEAAEELRRTGQEQFSVVPLFNQPVEQQGRLVVLSGSARQVLLVRVSDEDVLSRFGIDHYYQVFLFTDDSQSNPLVFCVRELPEGMPVGEGAEYGERVTVAGFFFNTWAYRNRRSGDTSTPREEWQLAPLLIGRDLKWHPLKRPASNPYLGAIAGGLFVFALFGVWLALWRYSRADKQFRRTTIARQFALDSGVSLDEIGLEADGKPDFSMLPQPPESETDSPGAPPSPKDDGPPAPDSMR
ncbi:MAG: hypothetical protein ABIP48_12355 [Planctomycetota bacterium]